MTDSATIHHAALAEAYRRTRGRYPAADGLGYDDLLVVFALDDLLAAAVAGVAYDDIVSILPFTSQ